MFYKVDPELVMPLELLLGSLGGELSMHDIPAVRRTMGQAIDKMKASLPPIEGVGTEDRKVPGPVDAPDVDIRIYKPVGQFDSLPALLNIHGGGYVVGSVESEDFLVKQLVKDVRCVAVSVEYRLAPEHPFPAALEDCYAALKWLVMHTNELNVRQERIAIVGGSAGGGLAAALALLSRDRKEIDIAFQLLIYPMIDDSNIIQASATIPDTLLWSRESNLIGWRSYLGREPGGEDVSPYAAVFRETDLTGLPAAYICVGGLDLFLHEDMEYAQRLLKAGVPTDVHVYSGAWHGFNAYAPNADVSQRAYGDYVRVLKRVLHSDTLL